jgi:hypothetical protein
MSAAFDTLDYLTKMHADTLGVRAVKYLRTGFRAGPATAGRIARLGLAAVQYRDSSVHGDASGWIEESPWLYQVELDKALELGHIDSGKAEELHRAFHSHFRPDERLELICKLRRSIALADYNRSLGKIQNMNVLEARLAQGLDPAGQQAAA